MKMSSLSSWQAFLRCMFLSQHRTSKSMYCVWLLVITSRRSLSNSLYLRCSFFFSFCPSKIRFILIECAFWRSFYRSLKLETNYSYVDISLFYIFTVLVNLNVNFSSSTAESGSGSSNLTCPTGRVTFVLPLVEVRIILSGSRQCVILTVY